MKKIWIFHTLHLSFSFFLLGSYNYESLKMGNPISEKMVTFIGKSHFALEGDSGLSKTVVLATPGTYVLSTDIHATSASGSTILITTDNVTLDLGGKSISFSPGGPGIFGCIVSNGVSNVTIRNGTLTTFGGGIKINPGCSNITIDSIVINKSTGPGIIFTGTQNAPISCCTISNTSVLNSKAPKVPLCGISLTYVNLIDLTNCSSNGHTSTAVKGTAFGFYLYNCSGVTLDSCVAHALVGPLTAAGFYADSGCSMLQLKNCQANLNNAKNGTAYGFFQSKNTKNGYENCLSSGTTASLLSAGFYLEDSNNTCYCECTSTNNTIIGNSQTTGAYGFLIHTGSCKNNYFDTCYAIGNKSSSDPHSYGCGFSLANSFATTIQNSLAQGNDGGGGTGIGIEIKESCSRCTVENNKIVANTSSVQGKAYGIYDQTTVPTTLFLNNFIFANRDESSTPVTQNFITAGYTSSSIIQNTDLLHIATLLTPSFINTSIV